MEKIVIYSTPVCPYCIKAKKLLSAKGAAYEEIDISRDPALVAEAQRRSGGRRTVPQIFIGDLHVGGCDDLYALDAAGKLDALLS
ncbi:MAG: glutaredoxin 3 [Deltaproteobacteria bacterium]|nr:glutaredoxin 3 [Deltaproteobacteria bacterium]